MSAGAADPRPAPPATSQPPVILHVRSSGGLFGADRVVLDLCARLADRGFEAVVVPIIEPDGSGEELAEAARRLGLPVEPLPLARTFDPAMPAALATIARQRGARLLHGHDYKSDLAVALARGAWRRVATLHGWVATSWSLRLKEAIDAFLVRRFDAVICVSQALARRQARRGLGRRRVIQNGIDLAPFDALPGRQALERQAAALGLDPALPVVGAVGRLSHEKGYDVLLAAVAELATAGIDTNLLLIGDGPEEQALRDQAARLGLAARLVLPGRRNDAKALYRLLDVFCMPSRREGLPLALLEAMASGCAAIVTPVGGIPEVVDVDPPVALVAPVDDPGGWAAALQRLVLGQDLRASLGAAARQRVYTRFSADAMTDGVAEVYGDVLATLDRPEDGRQR